MSTIYGRLGFNSSDPLTESTSEELSENVKLQLSLLPPLLNKWQTKDVAESNTSGYFQNPLAGTLAQASAVANNMIKLRGVSGSTNAITNLISNTGNIANTIYTSTTPNFLYHTNRQSNVIPPDENTDEVHYQTSMGIGKMIMYIVSQSDGITNNSPIIGNFTSLYTGNTLNTQITLATSSYNTLNNSITYVVIGGNTYPSSTITLEQAQELYNSFYNLNSTMVTYRNQDNTFYTNSKAVMDDYNSVRQFKSLGQTENDLIINKIGTPKIVSRLNDTANN